LIELLCEDVRISNKVLAEKTGVSVWTVASRLERLRHENLVATTVVVDWKLAGFESSATAFIRLEGDSAKPVTDVLRANPHVHSVSRTFGHADLIVHLLAEDTSKLRRIADDIGDIPGVSAASYLLSTQYHRIVFQRQPLPVAPWDPEDLPNPAVALDELDLRLLRRLTSEGHESNREIARRIRISENAVRSRLGRLEGSGMFRVVTVYNPFAVAEASLAFFVLRTRGSTRGSIVEWLCRQPDVPAVVSCLGAEDVNGLFLGESFEAIERACAELRAVTGVQSLTSFPVLETPFSRMHLVRLL
jgi:Lrp/AsnC family transcriptional regulator for asnA, asnC and gidA